jgi:hypothetical protein
MHCYTHTETPAVGICKSCGKAVCRSCAQDLGFAVACSTACANEATELHEMNQRGKRIYGIGTGSKKLPSGVIIWVLFAVFFTGFGIYQSIRNHEPEWFLLAFGALSAVIGFLAYRRTKDIGLQC